MFRMAIITLLLALTVTPLGLFGEAIPQYLYKIITHDLWMKSQGQEYLVLSPFDEAFIHLAEETDVDRIIEKFFSEEEQVVVLTLSPSNLIGKLVKEKNPGGAKEYYHLYEGKIPIEAIQDVIVVDLSK